MFENIAQFIRDICGNRSQVEWQELYESNLQSARNWLSENGEVAAVVGFGVGILLVLAFELLVVLMVISGLAGCLVWYVSSPTSDLARTAVKEFQAEQSDNESSDEQVESEDKPSE